SPDPDGSGAALRKNSMRKGRPGLLSRVPVAVRDVPEPVTRFRVGKFWRWFGPGSGSAGSLGVTPSLPRSIPRPVLPKMRLPRMRLPTVVVSAGLDPPTTPRAFALI